MSHSAVSHASYSGQSARSATSPECGDGELDWGEVCDDGNDVNGDGCDNECLLSEDYPCPRDRECASGLCLDGICVRCVSDDQCAPGRCVNNRCDIEIATPERMPLCGDAVLHPGEECDDGNRLAGDGCDSNCREERGAAETVLPGSVINLTFPGQPGSTTPGITGQRPPSTTQTGPEIIVVVAAGASAGLAWMRRRRR